MKLNGVNYYTPVALNSTTNPTDPANPAAPGWFDTLAQLPVLNDPALAIRLGYNAKQLAMTASSNATEFAADAVLGKRAQAALPLVAGAWVVIEWSAMRLGWLGFSRALSAVRPGIFVGSFGYRQDGDGYTRHIFSGRTVCENGKDPDECNKLKGDLDAAKDRTKGLSKNWTIFSDSFGNGCLSSMSAGAKKTRGDIYSEELRLRKEQHRNCFPNRKEDAPGENHPLTEQGLQKAINSCL